jgi:hypothetical protein
MRLAADPITVSSLRETVELRPSLRAATRLARRYAGYADLFQGVIDGNLTVIADLIVEGSGDRRFAGDVLFDIERVGLARWHKDHVGKLAEFVLALVGHDDTDTPTAGEPIPFEQYHTQLFKIAAGQLGWPPEDAWNASPAEIIAAYEGRCDLLRAIYGSADDRNKPAEYVPPITDENGRDKAFDHVGFHALKAKYQGANR